MTTFNQEFNETLTKTRDKFVVNSKQVNENKQKYNDLIIDNLDIIHQNIEHSIKKALDERYEVESKDAAKTRILNNIKNLFEYREDLIQELEMFDEQLDGSIPFAIISKALFEAGYDTEELIYKEVVLSIGSKAAEYKKVQAQKILDNPDTGSWKIFETDALLDMIDILHADDGFKSNVDDLANVANVTNATIPQILNQVRKNLVNLSSNNGPFYKLLNEIGDIIDESGMDLEEIRYLILNKLFDMPYDD